MCMRPTLNNQLELTSLTLFQNGVTEKNVFKLLEFHWDFINYNADTCMYCFEILILTCSDFTFDNVNFDLRKRLGFKYTLQLLNICLENFLYKK